MLAVPCPFNARSHGGLAGPATIGGKPDTSCRKSAAWEASIHLMAGGSVHSSRVLGPFTGRVIAETNGPHVLRSLTSITVEDVFATQNRGSLQDHTATAVFKSAIGKDAVDEMLAVETHSLISECNALNGFQGGSPGWIESRIRNRPVSRLQKPGTDFCQLSDRPDNWQQVQVLPACGGQVF